MDTENISDTQHTEQQDISVPSSGIKAPAGRPSVEDDPVLQTEYASIYTDHIANGLSVREIAVQRGISVWKVRDAIRWSRNTSPVSSACEDLIDAINACDHRVSLLADLQKDARLILSKEMQKRTAWDSANHETRKSLDAPDTILLTHSQRAVLGVEDRITKVLELKFTLQGLLRRHIAILNQEADVITQRRTTLQDEIIAFIKLMSPEDEKTFLGIVRKYAKPPH